MRKERSESRPVSRVLSRTVIPLGPPSLTASSNLPGSSAGHANGSLFGLAPSGVYLATNCCQSCGALLPHLFTLTGACALRRLFSVALSVGSRLPGVTWHSALWSPDFPPPCKQGSDCPADSPARRVLTAPPDNKLNPRPSVVPEPAGRADSCAPGDLRRQGRGTLERQLGEQQIEHPQRLGADRLLARRRLPALDQQHAFAALLVGVGRYPVVQLAERRTLDGLEGLAQLAASTA